MSILIAIALQAGMPAMTVPNLMVERCGTLVHLEPQVRSRSRNRIRVDYRRPATVVPAVMRDRTGGAVPMTTPGLTYDQPLAVRNSRTGEVVHHRDVVTHKRPVVVPVADRSRRGTASARDAYVIGRDPCDQR